MGTRSSLAPEAEGQDEKEEHSVVELVKVSKEMMAKKRQMA
jgi:hypothetical protein